jgi:uncharacterized protein DUF955
MSNMVLIENTAQEFWTLTGGISGYPRDLQTAIILTQPLELYAVTELRIADVRDWLQRVQSGLSIRGQNRRLHGCLIAERGKGTIFFDAQDSTYEQRFTLAHELAHFLLDYQAPRQRALATLGPGILPVLNSERPPTAQERLHGVFSKVQLGAMSHFMERPEEGVPATVVLDSEKQADQLALELLAPALNLQALMQQAGAPTGFTARLHYLTGHLLTSYGLPAATAPTYARAILQQLGEPTFRDWLAGNVP